ncbi:DUF2269 domain-containing protein [Pelagibius sp. CAU 1746]|uniref:DUF2269 family protein n=1 Tax=Pelagibius sp. CAU 1746 TaxID=3140370 RepID=UPI00325B4B40
MDVYLPEAYLPDAYLVARGLHIVSAIVLYGVGLGTAFQMYTACRSADVAGIARVARQVVLADWLFTTPAAVLQPASGLWLVHLAGYGYAEPWLLVSYLLYGVAGVAWLVVVALQIDMAKLAALALRSNSGLPEAFLNRFRLWVRLGWVGFGCLAVVIVLMVAKPALW